MFCRYWGEVLCHLLSLRRCGGGAVSVRHESSTPLFPHTFAHPVPSISFFLLHHNPINKILKISNVTGFVFAILLTLHFFPSSRSLMVEAAQRAAFCQVWIDAVLASSQRDLLDATQVLSLRRASRDQSESELCNNGDGRHRQVFGAGGIWPIASEDSSCRIILSVTPYG